LNISETVKDRDMQYYNNLYTYTELCNFEWPRVTLIVSNDTERRAASATAELLVKLTLINCHFTSASGYLSCCMKIIINMLFKHYYWFLCNLLWKKDHEDIRKS